MYLISKFKTIGKAFATVLLSSTISIANSAPKKNISIELNRLQQSKKNCITYFLVKNHTKNNFNQFKIELIIFDKKDIIKTRVLGDFKRIRPKKTLVKLFGIPATKCTDIGKILINDVNMCKINNVSKDDCLDLLTPSNKSTTELFK